MHFDVGTRAATHPPDADVAWHALMVVPTLSPLPKLSDSLRGLTLFLSSSSEHHLSLPHYSHSIVNHKTVLLVCLPHKTLKDHTRKQLRRDFVSHSSLNEAF